MKSFFQKSNIINDKLIVFKYVVKPNLKIINYNSPDSIFNDLNMYGFNFVKPSISLSPPIMTPNTFVIGEFYKMGKYYLFIKINNETYFSSSQL